ncbi:MAG: ImmA/IrrE family metallo-endopeptidase [Campylobacterota bacterium]|nr:ImmA/IrrE family metallo-endopeptidase [Campylobacterota bacterium]
MSATFYIDPIVEAEKYGVNVVADSNIEPVLQNGESGVIEKNKDIITMYINPSESLERQRFTIAHELGHYACGHLDNSTTMFRDGSKEYSRNNYDFQEYEANVFAAELLMPKEKIDFLINSKGITTVEELASILIVSYTAMKIRLQNLGWIRNYD